LTNCSVVEIGSGYGGQCLVLASLFSLKNYTLIDHPVFLDLSKKYLDIHAVPHVQYIDLNKLKPLSADLVISHFAFGESKRSWQGQCIEKVFKGVKRGYLLCSPCPRHFGVKTFEKKVLIEKIKKIHPSLEVLEENPVLHSDHFILLWNDENLK
jgi:hypothetical protein